MNEVLSQRHATKLHLKAMVAFKKWWNKLFYTQFTFLNNVEQLPIFYSKTNKHTHKKEGRGNVPILVLL